MGLRRTHVSIFLYIIFGIYACHVIWRAADVPHDVHVRDDVNETLLPPRENANADDVDAATSSSPTSSDDGSTYTYTFTENGTTKVGQPFHFDKELLKSFGFHDLPMTDFEDDLNDDNWRDIDYVFVTASSQSHFIESEDLVASIQKYFPNRTVLYYDWGLTPNQIAKLKTWCNVEYRYFNVTGFFPATRGRQIDTPYLYYAGKALTLAHALQDHAAVFYLDTSVRFLHGNLTPVFEKARENGGLVFFNRLFHSTWCVTHPDLYRFLPSSERRLQQTKQCEAVYFVYRARAIYEHVIWWLTLCAMEPACITPVYKLECTFNRDDRSAIDTTYAGCHRYDQSTVNVLAATYFGFDTSRYWVCLGPQGFNALRVHRSVSHDYTVQYCPRENQ